MSSSLEDPQADPELPPHPKKRVASEEARRDALAERNEGRKILQDMLRESDRGGLSEERAIALQQIFKMKTFSAMPKSERGLAAEKRLRLEGVAEMAVARLRNCLVKGVEEGDKEAEIHPLVHGVTSSYPPDGEFTAEEGLDEMDILCGTIEEGYEQPSGGLQEVEVEEEADVEVEQRVEEKRVSSMCTEWHRYPGLMEEIEHAQEETNVGLEFPTL